MRCYFLLPLSERLNALDLQRYWFIHGKMLGVSKAFESIWWDGRPHPLVCNVVYVCPSCGEDWARSVLSHNSVSWTAWDRTCEKCGRGTLLTFEDSLHPLLVQHYFPYPLLKREFILMEQYHAYRLNGLNWDEN